MKQTTPQRAIEAKAASIASIQHVQCVSNEYQKIMHYMVSDDQNIKNLSEYLVKKAKYNSFKTSVN